MTLDELKSVNAKWNACVYAAEVMDDWTPILPGGKGDCDSYATAKMQDLYNRGWPLSVMRLATCFVETGGYHCVLLVDWEGTTWVLDNRRPFPTEYSLLPYKWDKLQIAGTRAWEEA